MSNPTITLSQENLERLQRIGHLHCSAIDEETIVTVEMEDD